MRVSIERAKRLVERQNARGADKHASQRHALFLASRQD
jgi:hypothetical protein